MFGSRVAVGLYRRPILHLFHNLHRLPTTSEPSTHVYVSANRTRFYRTLGIFCFVQGSAWLYFGKYLLSKRPDELTWEVVKRDIYEFNQSLANRLESWTPDVVTKAILRPKNTVTEEVAGDVAEENKEIIHKEKEESDVKIFANRVREAFGVDTDLSNPEEAKKAELSGKRILPYICFVMGIFTYFVGGFIPRRIIRRISLAPLKSSLQSTHRAEVLDPLMEVNTYGWFGLFPPRGAVFKTPLSGIRATAEHKEGHKFMNVLIRRRPFAFYLETFEAQFILPEYFEHLNSKIAERKK